VVVGGSLPDADRRQGPIGRQRDGDGQPHAAIAGREAAAPASALPNRDGSLKFCVLGDFGTGDKTQYDLAEQMATLHDRFRYQLVVLVGDNLYGSERPQDFQKKFEVPYKALLDQGVKFYASLGNHDAREQRYFSVRRAERSVLAGRPEFEMLTPGSECRTGVGPGGRRRLDVAPPAPREGRAFGALARRGEPSLLTERAGHLREADVERGARDAIEVGLRTSEVERPVGVRVLLPRREAERWG
jgi:hypothetical protein